MEPTQVYDVIQCPANQIHAGRPKNLTRDQWTNERFGPLLGTKRVCVFHLPFQMLLLSADPLSTVGHNHLKHEAEHPEAGQDRYDWTPGKDGILLGKLKPEATRAS